MTSWARHLHRRFWAGLAVLAALLLLAPATASADPPQVIEEDNSGFACEAFPEGEPQVVVVISWDHRTGTGFSYTEVYTADGEGHVASGETSDVVFADGRISARYDLVTPDGDPAGEVVLEGSYTSGETLVFRDRLPYSRNGGIVTYLAYTPLEVSWTTFQVGSFDLSGLTCEGQRSTSKNRLTNPHRSVFTGTELRLLGDCVVAPLTSFSVLPAEVGVSLALSTNGYEGFTNLDLSDGSDTQPVYWYQSGAQEPAETLPITVSVVESGTPHAVADATPDGLVLSRVQPLTLTYEAELPGGAGSVSGECAAAWVTTQVAVEPIG